MKRSVIYTILLSISTIYALGQNCVSTDSIRNILSGMPKEKHLSYLDSSMMMNTSNMGRYIYAQLLYDKALEQQNEVYKGNAMFMFTKHFYSIDPDSMRYWAKQAEPLLLQTGRFEELCRIKAWEIFIMSREGKVDEVLAAVDSLKALSRELPFLEGIEMADQALADFYIANNMKEEGEKLYQQILNTMIERDAPLAKRYNIIRHLFNRSVRVEDRLKYLKIAEEYIEYCKKEGLERLDDNHSVNDMEYNVYRNYARDYLLQNDFKKGKEFLNKAQAMTDKHQLLRGNSELLNLYVTYYKGIGDYGTALKYLLQWEENVRQRSLNNTLPVLLKEKAFLHEKLGHYDEAYKVNMELIHIKNSIKAKNFDEILAEIRTQHEVDRLSFENEQMVVKAQQSRFQLYVLFGGCAFLLIVILWMVYLIRIIQKNKEELRQAKIKAEEANLVKSSFLANMNHEIRTPLNAIVGFSQVLIEEENKENRQAFAEIIQNNNMLLQRLIADVLDISKIESNSMSLIYSTQNIQTVMKEIYDTLLLRMQPEVKLILDDCPPLVMRTDRNRLVQVITNLLTNAIKHTDQGHIRFGYSLTDAEVTFYVEDTGVGIPMEKQEAIFDQYVQLENGKKGVGLGLAISKGLVTKMNGTISVCSCVGEGSTFFVVIPLESKGME